MNKPPIVDSYWVVPNALCAGEYPGAPTGEKARAKIETFRKAGVTCFLDLTEPRDGLNPYEPWLADGDAGTMRRLSFPIRDMSVTTPEKMRLILDALEKALADGECVYVHCWGGIGRTGTVIGCWLVEQGMTGREALAEIARLRAGIPDEWRDSPETREQRQMVAGWKRKKAG